MNTQCHEHDTQCYKDLILRILSAFNTMLVKIDRILVVLYKIQIKLVEVIILTPVEHSLSDKDLQERLK